MASETRRRSTLRHCQTFAEHFATLPYQSREAKFRNIPPRKWKYYTDLKVAGGYSAGY